MIEYAPPKIDQEIEEIRERFPVEVENPPEVQAYPQQYGQYQGFSQQIPNHQIVNQQTGFPDRSVVESYQLPPQIQSPRGYVQQGHQTLPPQITNQRDMPSPRGQLPPNARYTEQPFARPPPQIQDFQPPPTQLQYRVAEDNYIPPEVRGGTLPPEIAARISSQNQQKLPQRFVNYEGTHADVGERRFMMTDSPPQARTMSYSKGQ